MKSALRLVGGGLFSLMFFWGLYSAIKFKFKTRLKNDVTKDVEEQANEYFPVQSPSERAAGHPLVGTT